MMKLKPGELAGIVIGCIVGVLLIAVIIVLILAKRRKSIQLEEGSKRTRNPFALRFSFSKSAEHHRTQSGAKYYAKTAVTEVEEREGITAAKSPEYAYVTTDNARRVPFSQDSEMSESSDHAYDSLDGLHPAGSSANPNGDVGLSVVTLHSEHLKRVTLTYDSLSPENVRTLSGGAGEANGSLHGTAGGGDGQGNTHQTEEAGKATAKRRQRLQRTCQLADYLEPCDEGQAEQESEIGQESDAGSGQATEAPAVDDRRELQQHAPELSYENSDNDPNNVSHSPRLSGKTAVGHKPASYIDPDDQMAATLESGIGQTGDVGNGQATDTSAAENRRKLLQHAPELSYENSDSNPSKASHSPRLSGKTAASHKPADSIEPSTQTDAN